MPVPAGSSFPEHPPARLLIRGAGVADAAACAAIYAPYVLETAISFETEPPGPAEMAERIAAATRAHAWLVLESADRIVGYAEDRRAHSHAAAPL